MLWHRTHEVPVRDQSTATDGAAEALADRCLAELGTVPRGSQLAWIYREGTELFAYPAALGKVLASAWRREGSIGQPESWLGAFRVARYTTDTVERLGGELTIYRGCPTPTSARRMSWTLDLERARWFAGRQAFFGYTGAGLVYQGTVDSVDALAYFTGREEAEVVVDPKAIRDLQRIETVESILGRLV